MPAEPHGVGEPGSGGAAGVPGPALVMAAADLQPKPDPGRHRPARHALHAVGEGMDSLVADIPRPVGPGSDVPRGDEPDGDEPDGDEPDGKEPDGNERGATAAEPPAGEPGPYRGTVAAASARAPGTESGTVADLRRRLELLPHGHPSSPYHDDGERRPPPPRLKHLELAPPVKMVASRSVPATVVPPAPESDVSAGATPLPAAAQPAAHVQSPTIIAATATPVAAAQAIVAAAVGAKPPAAAHTSPDGSWSWGQIKLSRDLIRVADDAYDRFRAAEGRDLFGQYGKGGLTPMLSRVAERSIGGELAPETARNALLGPDEFRARLADLLGRHPDRSPEQLARRVPGTLSYSFLFDDAHYAEGIAKVQEALELQGFRLRVRRNIWSRAANRYVLTVWDDPLTDLPFHVQFHTQASLEAQRDGGTARR